MKASSILALVFLGLLAFCNAIDHPFVHDDVVFILKNPHIAELGSWYQAFKIPTTSGGINTYYRPVLELIYRLEYHFFGLHPFGYHLFNILVHMANGLLVFCLLQQLGLGPKIAWVVACIFLVHPVQTEAVDCIAGISNLWMALGVLLALNAYVKKWYVASLLCFILAFLSKEQAVMLVPLAMAIDYSRGEKNFRGWIFFIVAACALLILRQLITGASLLRQVMASPAELYLRLAAIPGDLGMYLRLIFFPFDLHYYRSTDILQPYGASWVMAGVLLLAIFYISDRWPKSRPTIVLGLGWFLAALLPVLNIAPLVNEYSFILTSEHFLYLPIVGVLIIAVVAADHFLKHFKKLIFGIVMGACLLMTWHQNSFWKSEIAVFERMLEFEPNFGRGHLLLAKAYYFNGRHDLADAHFNKALRIMTSYASKATNTNAKDFYLMFVREIFFDWSQNDAAMGHWASALDKLKQESAVGGKFPPDIAAGMYNNMAFAYLHLGDRENADLCLNLALRADPSFTQARRNLQVLNPQ